MNNEIYGNTLFEDMNIFNNVNMYNYNNLAGTYDGYIKGNMFKDLYKEYKNYKPIKLIPNNEQAEMLLNLNQVSFALNDIRLYLDNFPEDRKMIDLFNKYSKELEKTMREYENKFGPLICSTPSSNNIFDWEAFSFPWEMGEK